MTKKLIRPGTSVHLKNISIPEIAKLANVSIGTVDRAINNRPGINTETKEQILAIAQKYNYRPNKISRSLVRNKRLTIGAILLPLQSHFQQDVLNAIREQAEELVDFGFHTDIQILNNLDPIEQAQKFELFTLNKYDAVILEPIDHPKIISAINKFSQSQGPVVTFNTDLADTSRLCFVGQNLTQCGKVAADLLGKFMAKQGEVFILHGYHAVNAHKERVNGFLETIGTDFPQIKIAAIEESMDNEEIACLQTIRTLTQKPHIRGVYVAATGSAGACKAIKELSRAGEIRLVCNDIVPETLQFLRDNVIDATILQDPASQGTIPLKILFDLLTENLRPEREFYYTRIEILTKHMIIG